MFVTLEQGLHSVDMVSLDFITILREANSNRIVTKFLDKTGWDVHPKNTDKISFSGVICTFILGAFIFINFYHKEHGFITDIPQSEDPHKVKCIVESFHLFINYVSNSLKIMPFVFDFSGCRRNISLGTAWCTIKSNTTSTLKLTFKWFTKPKWLWIWNISNKWWKSWYSRHKKSIPKVNLNQ